MSTEAPAAGGGATPARAVDADEFRSLMSHFPTGVAVVTAVGPDGFPHGMTCTSLASVTLSPSTLLVCLENCSGTLRALSTSRSFAVNLLRADCDEVAQLFARPVRDRFTRIAWEPSARSESPSLARHAIAVADCCV